MTILSIIGIILLIVFILQAVAVGYWFYRKWNIRHTKMIIYGDAKLSFAEEALFYIVDNVKNYKHNWKADLDNIRIYADGKEISSIAYKSHDLPKGIRLLLSGAMNSTVDVISIIAAVKFDLWEISFDGGVNKQRIHQVLSKQQKQIGIEIMHTENDTFEHHLQEVLEHIEHEEKEKIRAKGNAKHGIIAHINEGKTTGTTMRYQVLVPSSHQLAEKFTVEMADEAMSFYHIYEGHAYKLDSKFVDKVGNLFEYDIINLQPGTIYVGFSTKMHGIGSIWPSSALYGITKDKHGDLPTIDNAILAKPKEGAEQFEMWNEEIAHEYLGEELTKRTYDVIVKKHYEDDYEDEYLSLSRTQEFYADYNWLKGHPETREEDIHTIRHIIRVTNEANAKMKKETKMKKMAQHH